MDLYRTANIIIRFGIGILTFSIGIQTRALIREGPWEGHYLFEGDIDVTHETMNGAVRNNRNLWPYGDVYYSISSNLDSNRQLIESAMRHIENRTCITFKPRDNEANFIAIDAIFGCRSAVGMAGEVQFLSLSPECMIFGIIVHELTHAIGFYHEHTRSDRDNYIDIKWNNIEKGTKHIFNKMHPSEHRLLSSFDYESIMMYGSYIFSKDGHSPTIVSKMEDAHLVDLDDKPGLSESDILRINALYKCNK